MITAKLPYRGQDGYGYGGYGAKRGNRVHEGIDFACYPGTLIFPVCPGEVTKLGWAYKDRPETVFNEEKYRYVEVTDSIGNRHRYFYVAPEVNWGERVTTNDFIGVAQDLRDLYKTEITPNGLREMTNHVHYEVINPAGEHINPEKSF